MMLSRFKRLATAGALLALLAGAFTLNPLASSTAQAVDAGSAKAQIFSKLNSARSGAGLAGMAANSQLNTAAQNWANSMANSGTVAHNPNRIADAGGWEHGWEGIAENVAAGQWDGNQAMDEWLASSGHRTNIMGNYNRVGIGVATGGDGRPYYVQLFGLATYGAALNTANLYGGNPAPAPTPAPPAPAPEPAPSQNNGGNGGGTSNGSGSNGTSGGGNAPAPEATPEEPAVEEFANPVGAMDEASASEEGVITLKGWAYDTDADGPLTVRLTIDGEGYDVVTSEVRDDVREQAGEELRYSEVGFSWASDELAAGDYAVQAVAVNAGGGEDVEFYNSTLTVETKPAVTATPAPEATAEAEVPEENAAEVNFLQEHFWPILAGLIALLLIAASVLFYIIRRQRTPAQEAKRQETV